MLMLLVIYSVLSRVPWEIREEDANILLLPPDGSTGLDLSFATHLFLLEKIKDPAMVSVCSVVTSMLSILYMYYVYH